ncbi:MAG: UvrD-helicase domain-containing protein [Chloroflexota bacterium]|nr:UvrD-helicase domain-containing protein [Chloroflexota bacterium]
MNFLEQLNAQQERAVTAPEGPILVLAGPGSGKTRVLTSRVAWLVLEQDVAPWRVMAVTFTNKAAREMRERLEELLGPSRARSLTLGTFHATCARILRREAEAAGVPRDYVIFDTDDQRRLIKQALEDLNLDDKQYPPRSLHSAISNAKSELAPPEAYATHSYYGEIVKRVYERYQDLLRASGGLDFDDLLMVTALMFKRNPEVLARYQDQYHHILVDEFQDTNQAQYVLLRQLSRKHHNLFCVADEDQCVPGSTLVSTVEGSSSIEELDSETQLRVAAGRGATMETAAWERRSREYDGSIVKIRTRRGRHLAATPNHVVFARMGDNEDAFYVYLMHKHEVGYRIGLVQSARRDGIYDTPITGLAVRGNQEKADKVWILKVCDDKAEATFWEQYFAFQYGLPTTVFFTTGRDIAVDQTFVDELYSRIDTAARAERLMADLSLSRAHPHHRPKGIAGDRQPARIAIQVRMFGDSRRTETSPWNAHRGYLNTSDMDLRQTMVDRGYSPLPGRRGTWKVGWSNLDYGAVLRMAEEVAQDGGGLEIAYAAFITNTKSPGGITRKFDLHPISHLHPGMIVPVEVEGRIVDDEVVQVDWEEYTGVVYDLNVDKVHNYVANGIVVHNSIYRWRGADYRNIRRLRDDHPEIETYLLERNYRSTQTILDAAQAVIRHNRDRVDKNLFTERGGGPEIVVHEAYDQEDEAQYVVDTIARLVAEEGRDPGDFAVMYRTNAQSRALEDAFVRAGLPYKLVGATRFYSRREVKDVLAFLRLVQNPDDDVSMARVINVPPRGIGQKTRTALEDAAREEGTSVYRVLRRVQTPEAEGPELWTRAERSVLDFLETLEGWMAARSELTVAELINRVLEDTGYADYIRDGSEEGEERWGNVLELRNVAADYENYSLTEFLTDVALVSDVDNLGSDVDAPTLLTLHSAKGLEFPVVFITGLEEGLLPHSRSFDEPEEMAEERRLTYVGLTRAEDRLFLSYAFRRTRYGSSEATVPSRFLEDIPTELTAGSWRRARRDVREEETTWERPFAGRRAGTVVTLDEAPSGPQFQAGQRVVHEAFGEGIVLGSRVQGDDEIVTVNFEEGGEKRLMASFAPMEVVGG